MTSTFIERNLRYDASKNQWGVRIRDNGADVFHECHIDPVMPTSVTNVVRHCTVDIIDDCPENFDDKKVVQLCRSYTAFIYEPNAAYKNIHCAICNNARLDKLNCSKETALGRSNWQENFNTFSFAVLFDLGGNLNESVGHVKACQDGQLYDPFFTKCRNVSCGSKEKIYIDGKCVSAQSSGESKIPPNSVSNDSAKSSDTSTSPLAALASSLASTIGSNLIEEIALITTEIETVFVNVSLLRGDHGTLNENLSTPLTAAPSTVPLRSEQNNRSEVFLSCPKFELDSAEFKMLNSSFVFIEKYNKVIDQQNFEINDNSLTICSSIADSTNEISKFGSSMSVVTVLCLGVSIVCLSLHILATFLSPELQNLSGKNLFSLSVALLGSYVCFVAAMFRSPIEEQGPIL